MLKKSIYYGKTKGMTMGRLIIDGKSIFEIDEECMKKKKIPKSCDVEKYLKDDYKKKPDKTKKEK